MNRKVDLNGHTMNFYTPHGHAAYATQQPINNQTNNNHNNHDQTSSDQQQQRIALQAALHTFDQLPAPSLREVLGAYRLKGDGDREMLLAILNAKAAEDQVCTYSLRCSFYL
jgi:hypothetical protein